MEKKFNVRQTTITLSTLALLTALLIVISMFCTIKTEIVNITLTFIPVVIAARLYGAAGAAAVAGLGDFIGWVVRPLGAFYPPITVTAMIVGVIFGLFLKNSSSFLRILASVLITQFIFSAFVTPIWLHLLYDYPYFPTVIARIPQILIMTAIELIVIPIMLKALDKIKAAKLIS